MKTTNRVMMVVLLALLLFPAMLCGQEEEKAPRGDIEFGVRHVWGDEFGRPDLPFKPDIHTSKFAEYRDLRNGFVVPRSYINLDNVLGSQKYLNVQSQSTFYRNQSYLASFGQYGKFKLQFRYDETPHTYTNTSRTLFTQTSPGVFQIPLAIRTTFQNASSTGTPAQINVNLPSVVAGQVPGETFIVPSIVRKNGGGMLSYNVSPDWNVSFLFSRENEIGSRPIGSILMSSPTASATTVPGAIPNRQSPGTGEELPEPIDYFTNVVKAMTEYGKQNWVVQLGYTGSFFSNNVESIFFDAPFATADIPVQIIPPGGGCTPAAGALNCAIQAVPAHGQIDLYPDNSAHYVNAAGAVNIGKRLRIMATANPGWLRQNDRFLPYTANTAITGLAPLPSNSLHGSKQTLAMNWTAVLKPVKDIELTAKYRHYDYNNNTPVFTLTPILGDTIGANPTATAQVVPGTASSGSGALEDTIGRSNPGFNRKTVELSGDWFFAKRSTVKVGWEGEWLDRTHRDVERTHENSVFGGIDWSVTRDLLFRISGRHQNREPDEYQDETVEDATGNLISCTSASTDFTEEQRCHRRFDEAARILDRADVLAQYNLQKFTFTGSFQTIQNDFNRRGGTNSPTPLNFLTGSAATTGDYFLYGALKDFSYIWAFDASYALTPDLSLFAEYTHERYHKRMISRSRTPTSGSILACAGCDTPNNDWESTYRDIFDTYAAGIDFFARKKANVSTFYSLSAGKGNVFTRPLGTTSITTGANAFTLVNTSAAVPYPETTTRIHDVVFVFKYHVTKNIVPKFEYRYQQFDNRDYQTSAMTPYMGCISPQTGSAVIGCPARQLTNPPTPASTAAFPTFTPNSFYPFFVVGDTGAARYLFLGADQPSYRAHWVQVTLEYHF